MFSDHGERETAARNELAFDFHFSRMADPHQVIQDAIDDLFVEGVNVAVGGEIKLERFGLDALLVRDVINQDFSKVGLTRHGAKRSKFRAMNANPVIAAAVGVWKRFQRCMFG